MIAHRGASAYAPENTMPAFEKARQLGVNFVEFDVMLSADKVPFVFHDDSLKRTTNGKGRFGKVSAEYIKTLDAGWWFSRKYKNTKIPQLEEILKWLIEHDIKANIEIKPFPKTDIDTASAVLTAINKIWPHSRDLPLVSSFSKEALDFCHSLNPELPIGYLMHQWDDNWQLYANELNCASVHLNVRIAKENRIKAIKDAGKKVYVYTVNKKSKAIKLLAQGVDAVFSDHPDLLL